MRLPRPYIPWSVREQVIDRQMRAAMFVPTVAARTSRKTEDRVRFKLEEFFAGKTVELHHDPALVNRVKITGRGPLQYDPDANDPAHLVYLVAGAGEEHDVRTRVRGEHGQHSDLALARKRRRKERKAKRPKRSWPKRKFPKSRGRHSLAPGRRRGPRAVRGSRGHSQRRGR